MGKIRKRIEKLLSGVNCGTPIMYGRKEATTALLAEFRKIIPEEKEFISPRNYRNNNANCEILGFNQCRADLLKRMEV